MPEPNITIEHTTKQPPANEKGVSLSTLGRLWDMGLDLSDSTSSRPSQPAAQVEWVYACLREIIKACRDIQLVFSTASEDIVESGPLYDLLLNNPNMPWMSFITETVGYLALHNEVYWILTETDGIKPKQILVAGRDQCRPVIRSGVLVGYELRVPGGRPIPLFLEDVYPILDFNPYDEHHGLGPLDAGTLAISSCYQATLLNEATLANGARIGTILVAPAGAKISDEEADKMKAEFTAEHGGARNAGKVLLARGGVEPKPFTQTMADLQMVDLRRFDAASICATMGVPGEVVGLNPEAQYAHGPAQLRFIQNTIGPMLSFVAGHLTIGLLSRFRFTKHTGVPVGKSQTFCGSRLPLRSRACFRSEKVRALQTGSQIFAWFDINQHPIMQQRMRETAESVLKFTASGVTLNNLIEAHDLPYEQQAWGDEWWIGMGQVPASYVLEGGIESVTGPPYSPEAEPAPPEEPPPEDEPKKSAEDLSAEEKADERDKLRVWRNWAASWIGIEREYQQAMRTFFVRQQRILIAALRKAVNETKAAKADGDEIIRRVVFDLRVEDGKIKVINQSFFEKAGELGIRQSLVEQLGLSGEKLSQAAEQAKQLPAMKRAMTISSHNITGVNRWTQNLVARQLRQGLDAGEDLTQLTARVKQTLGGNLARAQRIARTQTGGAVGSGRHTGLHQAGVQKKSWVTAGDEHVRSAHKAAGQTYVAGIPLEQAFIVGGDALMYPGDPAGSVGNIANCRCIEIAIKADGKGYSNYTFYSYGDMIKDKAGGTNNADTK